MRRCPASVYCRTLPAYRTQCRRSAGRGTSQPTTTPPQNAAAMASASIHSSKSSSSSSSESWSWLRSRHGLPPDGLRVGRGDADGNKFSSRCPPLVTPAAAADGMQTRRLSPTTLPIGHRYCTSPQKTPQARHCNRRSVKRAAAVVYCIITVSISSSVHHVTAAVSRPQVTPRPADRPVRPLAYHVIGSDGVDVSGTNNRLDGAVDDVSTRGSGGRAVAPCACPVHGHRL